MGREVAVVVAVVVCFKFVCVFATNAKACVELIADSVNVKIRNLYMMVMMCVVYLLG